MVRRRPGGGGLGRPFGFGHPWEGADVIQSIPDYRGKDECSGESRLEGIENPRCLGGTKGREGFFLTCSLEEHAKLK